jgi:hypothetical protein
LSPAKSGLPSFQIDMLHVHAGAVVAAIGLGMKVADLP